MNSVTTSGLLAGLLKGYTQTKAEQAHKELAGRVESRDSMLKYLTAMGQNQEVPTEHRQWAMSKAAELAQADVNKKLPKVDLGELPQAQIQRSPQQTMARIPGMTLTPPTPPQIGQAAGGAVNALGAGQFGPPAPPSGPALQLEGAPQQPSVSLPSSMSIVSTPTPPMPIAGSQGTPYLLTPNDRLQMATEAQKGQMQRMQAQFPDKTPAELAQFAEKGVWPKPEEFSLQPGEARFDATGQELARNSTAKAGVKSGFEPKLGPGGEPIGVTDVATGNMLTSKEIADNPHATSVFQAASAAHTANLKDQEAKENRQEASRQRQQARTFDQQGKMMMARQMSLSAATKTMVEAAPKVQDLTARVRADLAQVSAGPLASRYQEFMTGKVGVANPQYMKLRTDSALLQTLLMRMHVGARGGKDMMGHFKDIMDTSKQSPENLNAALDDIDSYAKDVQQGGVQAQANVGAALGRTPSAPSPPPATGGFDWSQHPVAGAPK